MSDKTLQEQIAEERAALAGLDVGADGDGGATPDQVMIFSIFNLQRKSPLPPQRKKHSYHSQSPGGRRRFGLGFVGRIADGHTEASGYYARWRAYWRQC